MTEDPDAYRTAVRRALFQALAVHGGEEVADVEEDVNEAHGVWGLDVTPIVEGAARVYVMYAGGDEVTLGFGETHTYLWNDDPNGLASEIEGILRAVFGGRFVEEGPVRSSSALVVDENGESFRLGAVGIPTLRGRHRRTYQPYS